MFKNIKTRVVTKHELEAVWNSNNTFVPLQGEIIIYDSEIDNKGTVLQLPEGRTSPYTYSRFKIGDGFTTVQNLPFLDPNTFINAHNVSDTAHQDIREFLIAELAKLPDIYYTETEVDTKLSGKSDTDHMHLYYGVCSTTASTKAKTVDIDNFELVEGAMVIVKFKNANSASSPTLNVSGTGAKPMYRYGTTAVSTGTTSTGWYAGAVQLFIYDGTGWVRDYWYNTTYTNAGLGQGYATCSTAAATTAKTATLSSYALTANGVVTVKFTNSVPANATLDINEKGAKAIYYRGAAITGDVIKAGDTATFIYNTNYHLIAIDRWQEDIKNLRADVDTVLENKADLDNGKVPTSQLPSYVDDVIEGTYVSSTSFKDTSGTALTGETGKIYVDTDTNKTYRWSGSAYVEISASLALGTTSSTAYYGDRGEIAYNHSKIDKDNPHKVTASDVGAYTKSEVDNYTLITTAEINTICSKR